MARRVLPWLIAAVVLAACEGTPATVGLEEPLRVRGAVFRKGTLPGSPAPDPREGAAERARPYVTGFEPATVVLVPGQVEKALPGRTTDDAYSIGIRLADAGSGYWVIPLGGPDTNFPGELSFRAIVDLDPELSPGEHVLQIVAFDEDGVAGEQFEFPLCALRAYDRSLNACDPAVAPPAAVISLSWNVDMDLDLVVRTPSGKLVDADHPTTAGAEGDDAPDADAPGVGVLDRDSNGGCRVDAVRRENLVFQHSPEPEPYLVYVNVFEACGAPAAHFDVESYVRVDGDEEGTYDIVPWQEPIAGIVLGASANGGANEGLFVAAIEFP